MNMIKQAEHQMKCSEHVSRASPCRVNMKPFETAGCALAVARVYKMCTKRKNRTCATAVGCVHVFSLLEVNKWCVRWMDHR